MQHIFKLFARILEALFPHFCVDCGTRGTLFCDTCLARSPKAPPVANDSHVHALFSYQHPPIKHALWRFKYGNTRNFAKIFTPALHEEILTELGDTIDMLTHEKYLIIPIPLHPSRLRTRGYNQSDLLARELIEYDHGRMFEYTPNILTRTKKTRPQARSERRVARIANLHDAFICHDHTHIRNRIVILIDDIVTTGATLQAAKHALKEARPRKIIAFTIAH